MVEETEREGEIDVVRRRGSGKGRYFSGPFDSVLFAMPFARPLTHSLLLALHRQRKENGLNFICSAATHRIVSMLNCSLF